jgi:glycerophosphoryl diester phosphodiesterase
MVDGIKAMVATAALLAGTAPAPAWADDERPTSTRRWWRCSTATGLTAATSPVFIQSLETGNLKKLKDITKVRQVQRMDDFTVQPYDLAKAGDKRTYRDLMQPAALAEIATYAYGIGPWKRTIVPETKDGVLETPTS